MSKTEIVEDSNLVDIASTIANKEIALRWNDRMEFSTNGDIIYMDQTYKNKVQPLQGLLAHEAGHIGYGTFTIDLDKIAEVLAEEGKPYPDQAFIFHVANVIEDVRVNEINKNEFPGFYKYLRREVEDNLLPQIRKKAKKELLTHINLFFEDYISNKPKEVSEDDWKEIKAIKRTVRQNLSPVSSAASIISLYKILKKHYDTPEKRADRERNTIPEIQRDLDINKIREHIRRLKAHPRKHSKELRLVKLNEEALEQLKNLKEINVMEVIGDLDIDGEGIELPPEVNVNVVGQIEADKIKKSLEEFKGKLEEGKEKIKEIIEESKAPKIKKPEGITTGRPVVESKIENTPMVLSEYKRWGYEQHYRIPTAKQVREKYSGYLKSLRAQFEPLKNKSGWDHYQKTGRLNSKLVRVYTSNFSFQRAFSKNIQEKELRILIMVDISYSMKNHARLPSAKIALTLLSEALKEVAEYKIVLFTGKWDARNIILKDWEEQITDEKLDRFSCHERYYENLDGASIKHEAIKLNKDDLIMVISDGQPSGSGYGLSSAINDMAWVRKKCRVFAFSIDAPGIHLTQLYEDRWILTSSKDREDLTNKLTSFIRKIIRGIKSK